MLYVDILIKKQDLIQKDVEKIGVLNVIKNYVNNGLMIHYLLNQIKYMIVNVVRNMQ
jgi:hypothetical protein